MSARADMDFVNDVRGAQSLRAPSGPWLLALAVGALLLAGVVWASLAVVEEVTRGDGKVIPSQQLQVVQVLDPGIVESILAREGDVVSEGQVLLRINDTGFASQLGEVRQRRFALQARIARLQAEAKGDREVAWPPEVQGDGPATAAEGELFRARAEKLRQEGSVVASQLFQRRQEFEELKASQRKLQSGLSLAERENEIMQRLRRQGAVPEIEAVRLERQLTTLKGELEVVNLQIPRAQAAIREAENKVEILDSTFRAGAREELAKAGGDLAVLDETMKAASDRVTRTTLRAPVRGIVNKVNVTTLGAVVQPGHTIVEIVPIEDKLLIEARVRPQDVAFIGPGQKATVKITAYDYAIYGSLPGVVERISADTTANDKGETFYRVIVRTDKSQLGSAEKPLPIIPGMIASVDILTGEKSVLSYLMKPLTKARHEALRER